MLAGFIVLLYQGLLCRYFLLYPLSLSRAYSVDIVYNLLKIWQKPSLSTSLPPHVRIFYDNQWFCKRPTNVLIGVCRACTSWPTSSVWAIRALFVLKGKIRNKLLIQHKSKFHSFHYKSLRQRKYSAFILTLTALWADSADDKVMIFVLHFPEKSILYFMQIVCWGDNLH